MRFHSVTRTARTLTFLAASVLAVACADKAFVPVKAAINPKMQLLVSAKSANAVAPQMRYLWVAVGGVIPGGDTGLLAMKNVPVSGTGTQTVSLDVDISECLAATSAKGHAGCSIIVGAALRADTISQYDTTGGDPFMRAFDFAIVGPFDVSSGKAPTIPTIDLSLSRFTVFDWEGDESLRLGSAQHVVGASTFLGRALGGTASGTGNPTVYTVTLGTDYSTFKPSQPFQQLVYPALAIFENGNWRRVLATNLPAVNPQAGNAQVFMDVTALATNDVYIAATTGLYKYDGTSFSKVGNISDSLFSVASAPLAGGGRVVMAGGNSGTIWVGYGSNWQKYTTPTTARLDGVCISGASEGFAISNSGSAIFRFNGTSLTSVAKPVITQNPVDLQCPGPGQAVVGMGGAALYKWSGTAWTALSQTGIGLGRSLRMAAASTSEIYAVSDSGVTDRAFYRYDGNAWTEIGRRRFTQGPSRLWADPRGGAAYVISGFGRMEKITPSSVSVVSYQPAMRDAVMTSPSSAFAVGWNLFLARWDGVKWTIDAPPAGTQTVRILQGVWSDGPSNAWAVGNSSTIVRYTGSGWTLVSDVLKPVAGSDNYNAVWGIGSDVWIAGDNTILRCKAGPTCGVENTGGGVLYSVWGSSASNVFAVGAGGRILRYNGSSWQPMSSPTARTLARVAGSGPSDVWAVGDSVLMHFDGTQWTNYPMTDDLKPAMSKVPSFLQGVFQLGLWVKGPKEAYLGGDAGVVVRWDGTGWRQMYDGFFFGRRILSITGSTGCAMALTEGQTDLSTTTLWRGYSSSGCLLSPMNAPSTWP